MGGEVKGDIGGQKIGGNAQIAENTIHADSSGCFRGALLPPQHGVGGPKPHRSCSVPPERAPSTGTQLPLMLSRETLALLTLPEARGKFIFRAFENC